MKPMNNCIITGDKHVTKLKSHYDSTDNVSHHLQALALINQSRFGATPTVVGGGGHRDPAITDVFGGGLLHLKIKTGFASLRGGTGESVHKISND